MFDKKVLLKETIGVVTIALNGLSIQLQDVPSFQELVKRLDGVDKIQLRNLLRAIKRCATSAESLVDTDSEKPGQ